MRTLFTTVKGLFAGGSQTSPPQGSEDNLWVRLRRAWRRRPRPVPADLLTSGERVQLPDEGHGPLFQRVYAVEFAGSRLKPEALMGRVKADLAAFSPRLLAHFKKTKGHPTAMQVGDEYHISILGPWNGSVRVVEVTPSSFTFITLAGHPEAGQITFSVEPLSKVRRGMRFEIHSWARSRDMIVGLSYKEVGIGKEVQKNAWVTFCERVVKASGGRALGDVTVDTVEEQHEGPVIPIS